MNDIKLQNFFIWAVAITLLMLAYVYQNIEIVKVGYKINHNQRILSYFVDNNRRLVYNLNKLESPTMLAKKINDNRLDLVDASTKSIKYASIKYKVATRDMEPARVRAIDKLLDNLTMKAEAINRK